MDKDRAEGLGKKVSGSIKEALGKITGDSKTQAEGAAEKASGTAQNALGGAKDGARALRRKEVAAMAAEPRAGDPSWPASASPLPTHPTDEDQIDD